MAQQEGPFSSYLDYMQKPIAPAPTGLEGTGMGIANVAMNFLQGLRQGRAQKYMQKEAEEDRKERLLLSAMQTIQKSGMLPEAKAQYEARIQQEFAKRVAGVKEGSKDTGNPLTDFFKRAGMSLLGGQPPGGKKADLDMNVALEAFAAASDPKKSVNEALRGLDMQAGERYRQLVKEAEQSSSGVLTDVMLQSDKQMQALDNEYRRIGRPDQSPIVRLARGTPSASTPYMMWQQQQKQQEKEAAAEASKIYSMPELPEGKLTPEILSQLTQAAVTLKVPKPKSTPVNVADAEGNVSQALYFEHPTLTGFYNSDTRDKLSGVTKATQSQINRGSKESITAAANLAISDIADVLGEDNPLLGTYANMVKTAKNGDDINRLRMKAIEQKLQQDKQSYAKTKDDRSFNLQLNKAENALPAQKQRTEITPLYSAVMSVYKDQAARAKMLSDGSRPYNQGLLISLIAKATDPMSVIRPSEIQMWGTKAFGPGKLDYWLERFSKQQAIELNEQEENALIDIADRIVGTIDQRISEEKGRLRAGLNLRTEPVPSEGATPANRPSPPGYTPPGAGRKVTGYNPGAK